MKKRFILIFVILLLCVFTVSILFFKSKEYSSSSNEYQARKFLSQKAINETFLPSIIHIVIITMENKS